MGLKILMLDIDGVLNSTRFFKATASKEELPTTPEEAAIIRSLLPHRDIPGEGKNRDSIRIDLRQLDPEAMRLLNTITSRPDVAVVVTSVWRRSYTVRGLRILLKSRGFVGKIIDRTVQLWGQERGDEIHHWITKHPKKVGSIAILDDDADMGRWMPRLVKTSMADGLQQEHVERVLELLSQPIV